MYCSEERRAYQRTEVASYATDLVLEDLVVETRLELSLAGGGRGDVHGRLATAQDHVVLLRGDACAVEGRVGGVRLEELEVAGGDQSRRLVLGGRDEVGAVCRPLQVRYLHVKLVDRDVVELLTGLYNNTHQFMLRPSRILKLAHLGIVLRNGTVLVSSDNVLVHVAPAGDGGLALIADDSQGALVALLGVDVELNIEDDDGAEMAHTFLSHTQQLAAILAEFDALDGRREIPGLEALAALDLPQPDRVVGAAARDEGRGRVHVHRPDGALVALVRA